MIAGCASKKGEEVYKTARYLETHNTGSPLKDQVKNAKSVLQRKFKGF